MSKPGIKVSGLISSGKIATRPDVQAVATFGRAEDEAPGELIPGREYMIRLDQLLDSPFQTRLTIDPARIDELGDQLREQGQIDAVEFRRGPRPGTLELIKGHTRKYGALSIGWEELRGLYKDLSDSEADIACMVDNTGKLPTEYEFAHAFKRAMTKGYANTQSAVGKMFGYSQGAVSKALAMLELPQPVTARLEKSPGLLGAKAAAVVRELWESEPTHHAIIMEALDQLADGMEQAEIRPYVIKKIAESEARRKKDEAKSTQQHSTSQQPVSARRNEIKSPTGNACYVTILKDKAMVIEFKDLSIPAEKAQEAVNNALHELAKSLAPKNGENKID